MCGRGRETLLGVVTSLGPHRVHKLGLGLDHPGGEGVGAHLHVHDLVGLGAHRLGDVIALVMVLDHLASGHTLLVAVSLEAGDTNLLRLLNIVQVTLARLMVGLDHTWAMHLVHLVTGVAITGGSGGMAITFSRCRLAITPGLSRLAIRS